MVYLQHIRKLVFCVLTPFWFHLYPAFALGADNQKYVLHVVDSSGGVVSGATVIVENNIDDSKQYFFSSENGIVEFSIDKTVMKKNVVIQVAGNKYQQTRLSLHRAIENGLRIVLQLIEQEIDEITVIASYNQIARAFSPTTLTHLEVVTNPSAMADPVLAVNSLAFSTNTENNADLKLRGSSAKLSKIYFNNVPVYEVVRGSSVDPISRDRSIFNVNLISKTEVYSSNPPVFLNNTAAGALSMFTNYMIEDQKILNVGSTGGGISISEVIDKNGYNFIQLYADYNNLGLLLKTNSSLTDIISSAEAFNAGMNLHIETDGKGIFNLFTHFDTEEGLYPLSIFAKTDDYYADKTKTYNILNYEYLIDSTRLKFDLGYSSIKNNQSFSQLNTNSHNEYFYAGGDAAFKLFDEKIHLRVGLAHENISMSTDGFVPPYFFNIGIGRPISIDLRKNFQYLNGYVYAVYQMTDNVSAQIGARHSLSDNIESFGEQPSFQGSVSISDANKRHKIIIGAGNYNSLALPEFITSNDINATGELTQYSIDYSYSGSVFDFGFGIYNKKESIQNLISPELFDNFDDQNINEYLTYWGMDTSLLINVNEKLSLSSSFTHVVPEVKSGDSKFKVEDSLDFLFRAGVQYSLSPQSQATINYTHRNGTYYTSIISSELDNDNILQPIFSTDSNGKKLSDFSALDVNLSTILKASSQSRPVILYAAVTNLLNQKTPSGISYNNDFTEENLRHYPGRVFSIGVSKQF